MAWQNWAPFTDKRLTAIIDLLTKDKGEIRALGEFTGTALELWQFVQPLIDAYPPKKVEIKTLS